MPSTLLDEDDITIATLVDLLQERSAEIERKRRR